MAEEPLSIAALISDLSAYDGREITVCGHLAIQRENQSIADNWSDDSPRRLWVRFHQPSLGMRDKEIAGFDRKAVVVTGRLKRGWTGHFSSFPAALTIHRLSVA